MNTLEQIQSYQPQNEQEAQDRSLMLEFLKNNPDAYLRSNRIAHMTASAWVTNPARTKVLMVYHTIYDSWSWCGGHADGDTDLLRVAVKECREETGIQHIRIVSEAPISLEALTVDGHEKHGSYVSSHLHLNVTYLLEADEAETLTVCQGENTAVRWFPLAKALEASTEPWFVARIYGKLNRRLERL